MHLMMIPIILGMGQTLSLFSKEFYFNVLILQLPFRVALFKYDFYEGNIYL